MAEISIIVPVYNVEKYLENCIESILNQTFKDFELILVDDGSTDNSGKICDIYKKKDSRIKVIHKNNGGLSSARNAGLDIASGQYIGFVDSDDSIHPQMYELLYSKIIDYDAMIAICNYKKVNEINLIPDYIDSKEDISIIEFSNLESLNNLYNKNNKIDYIISCNKLYNQKIFNKIRYPIGKIHEDEFIAHKVLFESNKIIYLDKELYYYLQRQNSIMGKGVNIRTLDVLDALYDRIIFFKENKLYDLFEKAVNIYIYKTILYYYQVDNKNKVYNRELRQIRRKFIKSVLYLYKFNKFSFKIIISWIIFYISPELYAKKFSKSE